MENEFKLIFDTPIYYDKIDQNSLEWHHLRAGKVTATGSAKLLVDGDYELGFGKGAVTYAKKLAAQIVSGKVLPDDENVKEKWKGKAVLRGKTEEPNARKAYELANFVTVRKFAFIQGGPYHGVSPDGVVFEDGVPVGGTEYKCYSLSDKHIDALEGAYVHVDQIQFSLWTSKLQWWDYCSWFPEMPEDKRLSQKRYYPDKLKFRIYEHRLNLFRQLVERHVERIRPAYLTTH